MKQIGDLQALAQPCMEDTCMTLWPKVTIPDNFFDLIVRLREAVPWITEWKSSATRKGAP